MCYTRLSICRSIYLSMHDSFLAICTTDKLISTKLIRISPHLPVPATRRTTQIFCHYIRPFRQEEPNVRACFPLSQSYVEGKAGICLLSIDSLACHQVWKGVCNTPANLIWNCMVGNTLPSISPTSGLIRSSSTAFRYSTSSLLGGDWSSM